MAEGSRRRRRQRRSPSEWAALLRQFENSGLTVREFCVQQDLGLSTFNRWRNRLRGELDETSGSEAIPFVRLDPLIDVNGPVSAGVHAALTDSIAEQAPVWDIELDLGDGLCLRLRRGR